MPQTSVKLRRLSFFALCLLARAALGQDARQDFLALIDRPRVPTAAEVTEMPSIGSLAAYHFTIASEEHERVPGILIKAGEGAARRLKFVPEPETQSEERGEWDSDHGTVRECIEAGVAEPVGWYLRDLVETLNLLANTLDSAGHTEGWRVEFVRARRGRPKSGSDQMLADGRLKTKIWEEQSRGFKKKESAVEGLKQKTGQGRSTILRKISRKRSS